MVIMRERKIGMCCRYYMESSPELKPFVDKAMRSPLRETMITKLGKPIKTEGEVRPTDIAPVVAPSAKSKTPTVFPMVWGFTNPKGGSPLLNARAETACSKPLWKDAWKTHRCVIPASYYFEWEHLTASDGTKKTGQKYIIQPKGSPVTYLAGLYQIEEQKGIRLPVFTVLTREPGEEIRFIHDRMPVILPKESVKAWISPEETPEEIIKSAITEMYYEKAL